MTGSISLALAYRIQIGSCYMRLVGVHAGTTVPVAVHVHKVDPGASSYSFELETNDVILRVPEQEFRRLGQCQIPTPPGEAHQICFEEQKEKSAHGDQRIRYGYGPGELELPSAKHDGQCADGTERTGAAHDHEHHHHHHHHHP